MKSTYTLAGTTLAALLGWVQYAEAGTSVLVDGATAAALCATGYPGANSGGEQLSACQWDMGAIHAGAAWARARGAGVKVGVIDGGVDFTHPDLAGAIDVATSCSFIYSTTPTAAPAEVANGDCSIKTAVQDLQGHGTHVATNAGRLNGRHCRLAPDATVVGLKACTIAGFCDRSRRRCAGKGLDVIALRDLSLFCGNDVEQRAICTI